MNRKPTSAQDARSMVRGLRRVCQLLLKETDASELLNQVCAILTEEFSYRGVWIATVDERRAPVLFAHAGITGGADTLRRMLQDKRLPTCAISALEVAELVVARAIPDDFPDCPLKNCEAAQAKLVTRLERNERVYGVLTAASEEDSPETRDLFLELAEDIACALERLAHEFEMKRLYVAIDQSPETVVITDHAARIEYVNDAFVKTSGYYKEEALGQTPRILKSGEHPREFYDTMWGKLLAGEAWSGQLINRRKNGEAYIEDSTIAPVRDRQERVVGYVAVKRDITEELERERKVQQAQRLESIGTLAGGIAHDFNNILTHVTGYAHLAHKSLGPENEKQREHLARVIRAGRRAAELINQILTYSRRQEQQRRPIFLHITIRETIELLRGSLPASIQIDEYIDKKCDPVFADPVRLHQALMNLCTNAWHAMESEGGTLEIGLEQFHLDSVAAERLPGFSPGPHQRLWVADTGCGIPQEIRERIFEPYFSTKAAKGTGLGLSTVRGIIREHDADISVESQVGRGTTFTMLFPVCEDAVVIEPHSEEEQRLVGGAERVMLVDDEPDTVLLMKLTLEEYGYTVTPFDQPAMALKEFRQRPELYDLAIFDLQMPQIDGVTLTRLIKEERPDFRVILCTGNKDADVAARVRRFGCDAIVYKPIDFPNLARSIRSAMDADTKAK